MVTAQSLKKVSKGEKLSWSQKPKRPNIINLNGVNKTYPSGSENLHVLKNINLEVQSGEFISLMGPSGSGKSTLLHIAGLLDRPTSGKIYFSNQNISNIPDKTLAQLRNQRIGFVFQSFFLLPYFDALDNVCLPLQYSNSHQNRRDVAIKLLSHLGLGKRLHHKPRQLSGGEMQRVAIARALINKPDVLCADEPTGNLDSKTGIKIMEIISEINAMGTTVLLVTHDSHVASYGHRIIHIHDGEIHK